MRAPQTYLKLRDSADLIQSRIQVRPKIGFILGSGLGPVADSLEDRITIPYSEIPHFHGTSVEGHAGRLLIGMFEGVPAAFLQGRFHRYEGYEMEEVVFPTRTLCALGIETLVITNAAGGINTRYRPGDLMIIDDHINLMSDNPLKGPNLSELGPRFPDMSEAYSQECNKVLEATARDLEIPIQRGVYAGVLGPTYETPAEVRMLRTLGADAVGMSTVPENIAANHLGVRVCGVSCITNLAAGLASRRLTHDEVIENGKLGAENLAKLLKRVTPKFVGKPEANEA